MVTETHGFEDENPKKPKDATWLYSDKKSRAFSGKDENQLAKEELINSIAQKVKDKLKRKLRKRKGD